MHPLEPCVQYGDGDSRLRPTVFRCSVTHPQLAHRERAREQSPHGAKLRLLWLIECKISMSVLLPGWYSGLISTHTCANIPKHRHVRSRPGSSVPNANASFGGRLKFITSTFDIAGYPAQTCVINLHTQATSCPVVRHEDSSEAAAGSASGAGRSLGSMAYRRPEHPHSIKDGPNCSPWA